MTTHQELSLEEKMVLIKEKEQGVSHQQLGEKFQISLRAVSNILKHKCEYTTDYEAYKNKKIKRKSKNDLSQEINQTVYEWFVAQRAKNIAIFGPVLREYARQVGKRFHNSEKFKASKGWLDRFRTRYNIHFRVVSGESRTVDQDTIIDWKSPLYSIIEHYDPADMFNCDETGLFYNLMPDRSLMVHKNDCKGGKKSNERYTVMLCTNWSGTGKLKLLVIGKFVFVNSHCIIILILFTEWLNDFDSMMRKQKRNILLFLDNVPVHSQDIQLENIKLKFFPPNTTSKIQPLDQGIIRVFKAQYRRYLVNHIIANAGIAVTAEYVTITALDAVCWIQGAWSAMTEMTIQNTFKSAGFERCSTINKIYMLKSTSLTDEIIPSDDKSIEELDRILKHLTIGGKSMSGYDYVVR